MKGAVVLFKETRDGHELNGMFCKAHLFTTAHHEAKANWDYTGKSISTVLSTILPMIGPRENIVFGSDGCAAQNWSSSLGSKVQENIKF